MATLEELGEVISTDVLIIGGGIGGLAAAIKVKEDNPQLDVLIVEKQTAGWAGKATKIGGILAFLGPNNNADKFLDFQVRTSGFYLNDQELLSKYIQSSYKAIRGIREWGAKLARTPDGKLVTIPAFWAPEYSLTFIDIDLMLPIRAKARKLGTRIIEQNPCCRPFETGEQNCWSSGLRYHYRSILYIQGQGYRAGERQLRL